MRSNTDPENHSSSNVYDDDLPPVVAEHRIPIPRRQQQRLLPTEGYTDSASAIHNAPSSSAATAPAIRRGSPAQQDTSRGSMGPSSSGRRISAVQPIQSTATPDILASPGTSVIIQKIPFQELTQPGIEGSKVTPGAEHAGEGTSPRPPAEPFPEGPAWLRRSVIALCTLMALISYLDRACIGVAIIPMAKQFGWNESTKGAVSSIFFVGYTATNIAGGFLATKYGAKLVLAVGVVFWSAFTILTPAAAASGSLAALLVVRCLMGAGEGLAFPSVQQIVSDWAPLRLRTRTNGIIFSGSFAGTIVSYATAPAIINAYGWEKVFIIYGCSGVIWVLFWVWLVPTEGPLAVVKQAERRTMKLSDVPCKRILSNKMVWAILATQSFEGVGQYVVFFWIPSYYNSHFGVDIQKSAAFSISPWAFTILFTLVAAWAADKLVNKGFLKLIHVRKLFQSIAGIGGAICFMALSFNDHLGTHGAMLAMAIFTLSMSLSAFGVAGADCSPMDISPKYAAIIFGLINGLSTLAASTSIWMTGIILDHTSSWALVFQLVAFLNVLGVVIYNSYVTSEVQIE